MMDFIRNKTNSFFVKVLFSIIIAVFIFYFGFSSIHSRSNTILAYVNNQPISITAFRHAYEQALDNLYQQSTIDTDELKKNDFKRQILHQMIIEELLQEEANKLGLIASDEEIRQEIARMPAFQDKNGQFKLQIYRHILHTKRISTTDFEQEIKTKLVCRKLIKYVTVPVQAPESILEQTARDLFSFQREKRKISYLLVPISEPDSMPAPTAQAVEAYYANHLNEFKIPSRISINYIEFSPKAISDTAAITKQEINDFYEKNATVAYMQKERVRAKHILLMAKQNTTVETDIMIRRRVETVRQRLVKGEKFEEVAREVSEDEFSSAKGGDLGWIERGQTVESFEKAAFNLPLDTVSEPIRTTFGWHLILVENHEAEQRIPLNQVKNNIAQIIAEEQAVDRATKLLDQALALQLEEADLTKISSELGLSLGKQTDFSRDEAPIKLPGLTPKAVNTLFSMLPGETTSTPIQITQGFLLATVTEVKPEETLPLNIVQPDIIFKFQGEAALEQARQKAKELLTAAQKNNNISQPWLAQFQNSPSFSRQDIIQGLEQSAALAEAAFIAKPGEWLPTVYLTGKAACIARLTERIEPSEEQWSIEKNVWQQEADRQHKREVVQAFLDSLLEKAKIEPINLKLIE